MASKRAPFPFGASLIYDLLSIIILPWVSKAGNTDYGKNSKLSSDPPKKAFCLKNWTVWLWFS